MSLFLIGPSGVGKSTLKERLLKDFPGKFEESISCTTRAPRSGEVDKIHYYFIKPSLFKEYEDNDYFLEWEEVHENKYGTLISEVSRIQKQGKICVFDIDLKGANNLLVRLNEPKENVVFILPEKKEDLITRLRGRETENTQQIDIRMKRADWEIAQADKFPNKIVNKDLDETYKKLVEILRSRYDF